jgi:hypothetical protein
MKKIPINKREKCFLRDGILMVYQGSELLENKHFMMGLTNVFIDAEATKL